MGSVENFVENFAVQVRAIIYLLVGMQINNPRAIYSLLSISAFSFHPCKNCGFPQEPPILTVSYSSISIEALSSAVEFIMKRLLRLL